MLTDLGTCPTGEHPTSGHRYCGYAGCVDLRPWASRHRYRVNGAEALVVGAAPGFNLDGGRGCAHNPGGRPPVSLAAGSRLGPYEIVSPLGTGGMGEVYRARDTRLGRELSHPNILALYDVRALGSGRA